MYNVFIALYHLGIQLAALGNGKAKQWVVGRKNLWSVLEGSFPNKEPLIWVHSASAGEFEQAKPVIEALKKEYPTHKMAVTFFSPSGYSVGKKNNLADYVFYLPLDTHSHAKRFVSVLQPQLVVFVKYDYWYHHLKAVKEAGIPLLLVSSIFRKDQAFFKWYGLFYLNMLHFFTQLFVQDEASQKLLQQHGVEHVTVSGDTRFDRVATIAATVTEIEGLKEFVQNKKVIVAGSTWPEDEQMLQKAFETTEGVKLIIAPHEIHEEHIKGIERLFPDSIRYSALKRLMDDEKQQKEKETFSANVFPSLSTKVVMIIDNIGMLSRLYQYATITYIGGGFNKSGIHNTLEAAVWRKPVIWGPNYQKFREAKALLQAGGFTYTTSDELKRILNVFWKDAHALAKASVAAGKYVQQNGGATQTILYYIQEKRLLTKA